MFQTSHIPESAVVLSGIEERMELWLGEEDDPAVTHGMVIALLRMGHIPNVEIDATPPEDVDDMPSFGSESDPFWGFDLNFERVSAERPLICH